MKKRSFGLFSRILRKKQWVAIFAIMLIVGLNAQDALAGYGIKCYYSTTVYGDYGFTHYCSLYNEWDTYYDRWYSSTTHTNPNGYYFSKYGTSCYSSCKTDDGYSTKRSYAYSCGNCLKSTSSQIVRKESFALGHAYCGCDGSRAR